MLNQGLLTASFASIGVGGSGTLTIENGTSAKPNLVVTGQLTIGQDGRGTLSIRSKGVAKADSVAVAIGSAIGDPSLLDVEDQGRR